MGDFSKFCRSSWPFWHWPTVFFSDSCPFSSFWQIMTVVMPSMFFKKCDFFRLPNRVAPLSPKNFRVSFFHQTISLHKKFVDGRFESVICLLFKEEVLVCCFRRSCEFCFQYNIHGGTTIFTCIAYSWSSESEFWFYCSNFPQHCF